MNNRPVTFVGSLLLALLFSGAGCNQDPYGIVSIGDAILPSLPEAGTICQLTNGGVEICDGVDNNCDGQLDEEFNTLTNPRHCGKCNNSCLLTGAVTDCNMGKCVFISCAPGFFDLNSDLSDGCEYECSPTGDELCDEVDNNCNGKIDEAFDLDTDVANCGTCGHSCLLANAVPKCVEGECLIHQCKPGFIDQDGEPASGCEEPCTVSNSGIEACDGKDNDCNGVVDDPNGIPIDFKSDPFNCGACGVTCTLPNAEVTCQGSKCMISQCEGTFVNADGVEDNGCECSPLDSSGQPLVEICDGADNDCNGVADNNLTGVGDPCPGNTTGSCFPGILTCANGIEVCTGKVEATYEHCDNLDTDCDGSPDPAACLFPAAGREQRLDELNTSTLGYHNSAHLHVAGRGQNLLAVWLDRRNGLSDIYGQGSMDGGVTWQSSDFAIATESRDKVEPKAGIGGPYPTGSTVPARAYVVYERYDSTSLGQRDVRVRRLQSDGTWSSAQTVETYNASSGDSLFVQMAVLPGATASAADVVAICWERIAVTGSINPNIRCTVSINSGSSYINDIQANLNPNNAILPKMAIDSSTIYLTWQEGTNIRAARAPIPTASSPDLVFASQVQLNAAGGPGLNPVIAADGSGAVIVAWEDIRASLINIRANRSQDHGATWGNDGVRVDNDVVDGDSISPSIAIRPGGRAFIAWSDTNRGTPDIYVNFSDDGGLSWSSVQRLASQDPAGPGSHLSTNPVIAVAPAPSNNVYVAWEEIRAGAKREVYFNLSLNGGEDWNIPDARQSESSPPGAADIRRPYLWASSGRAAVIWLDYRVLSGGVHTTGPNGDIYTTYLQ